MTTNEHCIAGPTLLAALVSGVLAMSMSMSIPAFASSTDTAVTLQTDDTQLSVTAPATMPMTLRADGTFVMPNELIVTNNSVMPIAVKDLLLTNVLNGTSFARDVSGTTSSDPNYWDLQYDGQKLFYDPANDSGALALPLTSDETLNIMPGKSIDVMRFTGSMTNIDGSVDFTKAQKLVNVVWGFGSKLNPDFGEDPPPDFEPDPNPDPDINVPDVVEPVL